jgi:hypothetical protein
MDDVWEINGITGRGTIPTIAGTFSGPLVVMGTGRCLWDDLAMVKGNPDYMAINMSGCFVPKKISHWASKHPGGLPYYIGLYHENFYPTDTDNGNFNFMAHIFRPQIYSHAPERAEVIWDFAGRDDGSSSMFGVMVGLVLGYDPIWLAGVPIDGSGRFYDPPGMAPFDYGYYQQFWSAKVPIFENRVKSFSGFTATLLGKP